MNNKVKIQVKKDSTSSSYLVQSISIKKGADILRVPSPFGVETMIFDDLDSAISAIKNVGYDYIICGSKPSNTDTASSSSNIDYGKIADVFIKNLGNENLEIRTSSINALAKFGASIADKLIKILSEDNNWLVQQSAIKCIEKIIIADSQTTPLFLDTLIELSDTENNLLKSAVLKALEQICALKPE